MTDESQRNMTSSRGYSGDYSSYGLSDTSNTGDWLSSPLLDAPEWPNDNIPNEAYAVSPSSTPELYTPQTLDLDSTDYFTRPFSPAAQPSSMMNSSGMSTAYPQVVPPSGLTTTWNQATAQSNSSYVPLSLIHNPMAQPYEEVTAELTEGPILSPTLPLDFMEKHAPQVTFKGTWGTAKESTSRRQSSNSRPGKSSTRRKEKEHQTQSKRSSVSSTGKGHQLRSTRTGQRITYSEHEDDERMEQSRNPKSSHNMVEKQYRNRLNGQFSTLLGALPPDLVGAEVEGYGRDDSGSNEKKVSKAEVLVLAKRHIENLQREKMDLEDRNNALLGDMQRLKGAWVGLGGQVLP